MSLSEGKTLSLQGFEAQRAKKVSLLEQTRELILAHGWNTTSYQILNPGIKGWFSAANDALRDCRSF